MAKEPDSNGANSDKVNSINWKWVTGGILAALFYLPFIFFQLPESRICPVDPAGQVIGDRQISGKLHATAANQYIQLVNNQLISVDHCGRGGCISSGGSIAYRKLDGGQATAAFCGKYVVSLKVNGFNMIEREPPNPVMVNQSNFNIKVIFSSLVFISLISVAYGLIGKRMLGIFSKYAGREGVDGESDKATNKDYLQSKEKLFFKHIVRGTLIYLLFGCLIFWSMSHQFEKKYNLRNSGEEAIAHVTATECTNHGKIIYDFPFQGNVFKGDSNACNLNCKDLKVGESLDVRFLPDQPNINDCEFHVNAIDSIGGLLLGLLVFTLFYFLIISI